MVGLLPHAVKGEGRGRASRVPEAVREEIARLKALDGGFHYRELARLVFCKFGRRLGDKTVKKLRAGESRAPAPASGTGGLSHAARSLPRPAARGQTVLSGLGRGSLRRVLEGLPSDGGRLDRPVRD